MAGKYNIHKAEKEKNVKEKDLEYHRSAWNIILWFYFCNETKPSMAFINIIFSYSCLILYKMKRNIAKSLEVEMRQIENLFGNADKFLF